uniref:Uncharacterized protein n=1 Tax=Octopus bimaculoides TaxID=37653 RepID=A0A0L8GF47_OCTBM
MKGKITFRWNSNPECKKKFANHYSKPFIYSSTTVAVLLLNINRLLFNDCVVFFFPIPANYKMFVCVTHCLTYLTHKRFSNHPSADYYSQLQQYRFPVNLHSHPQLANSNTKNIFSAIATAQFHHPLLSII